MDYQTSKMDNMTLLTIFYIILYLPVLLHALNAGSYPKPPEEFPFCHSCEGYCGLRRSNDCSCDHLCFLYEDCCHDFRLACSQDNVRGLHLIERFGGALPSCSVPHVEACWDTIIPPVLIASCPQNDKACRYIKHDIYSFLPVSDNDTGLNFINIKCAICNGIRNIKPWGLKISDVQKSNVHARDPIDDLLLLKSNRTLYFSRPPGQSVKRCSNAAPGQMLCADCRVTDRGRSFNYTYPSCELSLQENRNFTQICNSSDKHTMEVLCKCVNCRSIYNSTDGCISRGLYDISKMSLSILFDFTDSDELSVQLKLNRVYKCPPGYIRKNIDICGRSENIPAVELNGLLDTDKRELNETCSSYELFKICLQRLKETLQTKLSLQHNAAVDIYFNDTSRVVGVAVTVNSETYRDIKPTEVAAVIKDGVTHEVQLLFNKNPWLIKRVNMTLAVYVKLRSQPYPGLYVLCQFTLYETNIMKSLFASTATANVSNANVACLDYLVESDNRRFDKILTIMQIVLQSLSLVALGIRIGMYMIIKEFRDPSGRLLTAYMAAMLLFHLLFLLRALPQPGSVACYVMGVFLHWFYLIMFAWMSVLAVDIARMILSSSRLHKINISYKNFAYYCVVAIGLPALIVTVSFIVDQTNVRADLKPNYGGKHCWISRTYPLLIFSAVPVAGVLLLNGVCFTVAVVLLCRTAYACSRSVDHRANTVLYMKLFVLMGLTWSLGFVSKFTGSSVVRYLYTILNASQGLLVAVAAICSSHSRTILREKFTERTKSGSTKCQGSKRPSSVS